VRITIKKEILILLSAVEMDLGVQPARGVEPKQRLVALHPKTVYNCVSCLLKLATKWPHDEDWNSRPGILW
jgi:hypothetical protein